MWECGNEAFPERRFPDVKLTTGNNGVITMTRRVANISQMLAVCTSAHFILTVTYEAVLPSPTYRRGSR